MEFRLNCFIYTLKKKTRNSEFPCLFAILALDLAKLKLQMSEECFAWLSLVSTNTKLCSPF